MRSPTWQTREEPDSTGTATARGSPTAPSTQGGAHRPQGAPGRATSHGKPGDWRPLTPLGTHPSPRPLRCPHCRRPRRGHVLRPHGQGPCVALGEATAAVAACRPHVEHPWVSWLDLAHGCEEGWRPSLASNLCCTLVAAPTQDSASALSHGPVEISKAEPAGVENASPAGRAGTWAALA